MGHKYPCGNALANSRVATQLVVSRRRPVFGSDFLNLMHSGSVPLQLPSSSIQTRKNARGVTAMLRSSLMPIICARLCYKLKCPFLLPHSLTLQTFLSIGGCENEESSFSDSETDKSDNRYVLFPCFLEIPKGEVYLGVQTECKFRL